MIDFVDVSAAIVLYNTDIPMLERSIRSFLTCKLSHRLLLVDNSPQPVQIDIKQFENVDYVFVGNNGGFGAGHNIAIKHFQGTSKYHLILNPDVFYNDGVVEELYAYLENNPSVAHIMPKVLFPDGGIQPLCRGNPNYFNIFFKRAIPSPLKGLFKKSIETYEPTDFDYDSLKQNVPFLSGCFMLVRTDVLQEIGGFDEKFFLYFEDADISRRILAKHKNTYYPNVHIYHEYQRGTTKSLKHILHACRGLVIYMSKHK